MKTLRFGRVVSISVAAATLVGCSPPQGSPVPSAAVTAQGSVHRDTNVGNCPPALSGTGILPDGDFSQAKDPGNHNITPGKGTVFAPDWIVSKGNIDFNGSTYWDMGGLCSVDLDGLYTVGGIKSRSFLAKSGTHTLSFEMSGNGHCSPAVKTMKISIDKQFTAFTWDTTGGHDVQHGHYTVETWKFHATRLSILRFVSQDPPGSSCGMVIAGMAITKT